MLWLTIIKKPQSFIKIISKNLIDLIWSWILLNFVFSWKDSKEQSLCLTIQFLMKKEPLMTNLSNLLRLISYFTKSIWKREENSTLIQINKREKKSKLPHNIKNLLFKSWEVKVGQETNRKKSSLTFIMKSLNIPILMRKILKLQSWC